MDGIRTADGHIVTEKMIDEIEAALEEGRWPDGWVNMGEVVHGAPPIAREENVVLSVKVPAGLKKALDNRAKAAGTTTSATVRGILERALIAS